MHRVTLLLLFSRFYTVPGLSSNGMSNMPMCITALSVSSIRFRADWGLPKVLFSSAINEFFGLVGVGVEL